MSDSNDANRILGSLPQNLSMKEVMNTKEEQEGSEQSGLKPNDTEETIGEEDTTTNSAKLKIAWQYEKYMNKDTNPLTNVRIKTAPSSTISSSSSNSYIKTKTNYCCSYDISSKLQPFLLKRNPPFLLTKNRNQTHAQFIYQIEKFIKQQSTSMGNGTIRYAVRVFMPLLCGYDSYEKSLSTDNEVLQSLLSLKHAVRNENTTSLFLTVQPSIISPYLRTLLTRIISDYSLSVETLAGRYRLIPSEFKDFLGFFSVNKIQQYGQLASIRPSYNKYGLKRDRRKLYIEPLHLPPDDGEKGRGETIRKVKGESNGLKPTSATANAGDDDSTVVRGSAEVQLSFEEDDASNITPKLSNQPIPYLLKPVAISSFKQSNSKGFATTSTRPKFDLAQSKAKAASMIQASDLSSMNLGGGGCSSSGSPASSKNNLDF